MSKSDKNLRTCKKGHQYFKSSDCPVCPVCAAEEKPENGFLVRMAAPARRALENNGITTLEKLANLSEADLLKLHGFGQASLPNLRSALAVEGLSFKKK